MNYSISDLFVAAISNLIYDIFFLIPCQNVIVHENKNETLDIITDCIIEVQRI